MELVYHDLTRIDEVKAFIQDWEDSSDYIHCITSGSTGIPKRIKLSKKQIEHSAARTIQYFGLHQGMKAGLALSMESIAGKLMVVRSILARMELHVLPVKKNPLAHVDTPLDFIALVPSQAAEFLKNSLGRQKDATVLIGGAPLSSVQHQAIYAYWKHAFQSYGMTETASHVALRKITSVEDAPYEALDGIRFSEAHSQLVIHCKDLIQGEIHTTDCVDLLSPSSFRYLGRVDHVINTAGNKVHPEELEFKLKEHIAGAFMIIPYEDALYGQGIGLLLIDEKNPLTIAELKTIEGIKTYEIPRKYMVVPEIIRNSNDKIDRNAMLDIAKNHVWTSIL
jgi:O-succinylbenzoic acid--CoA ligase